MWCKEHWIGLPTTDCWVWYSMKLPMQPTKRENRFQENSMEPSIARGCTRSCRPAIASAMALLAVVSCMLYSLAGCTITHSDSLHIHGFSNAALSGKYTYTISGLSLASAGNNPYQESGVFIADGKGNLTGGVDDIVQGGSTTTSMVAGNYHIASDGTGQMSLTGTRQVQLALT